MSAVTHWDVSMPAAPLRGRRPQRHLRLVPPPAAHRPETRDGVRLTVRGRRVLVLAALATLLLAGLGVSRALAGSAPAADAVVVQSGQTLSQVAHAAYPSLPIWEAVVRVQQANDMNSLQVHSGQHLVLPR